jgi:hypothetical protein
MGGERSQAEYEAGVFGQAPVRDNRFRLQTFSKLFPNFLQIFGGFLQAFPNFSLVVLGDFRGLEGKKFGERPFRFSPNFWPPPGTQFFAQGVAYADGRGGRSRDSDLSNSRNAAYHEL